MSIFCQEFLNLHHQCSLFKHISPFLLTHEEWEETQNETKKYWKLSLYLPINIKDIDFLKILELKFCKYFHGTLILRDWCPEKFLKWQLFQCS